MRVLIVEDDRVIAGAVARHIGAWGCETRVAEDFKDITGEFVRFDPQLVLLDIGLPYYNGFYWCGEIRKLSKAPIIFLSSAADNMNIVLAVNMGADDFIAKPFDLAVLTAKVQALLRRTYDFNLSGRLIEHRGLLLNLDDGTVSCGGSRLELSRNEYRILQVLLENRGRTVSRETLMQRLWETDSFVDENTLSVNIARLRRKLEGMGLKDLIETRKGQGYLIE